MLQSLTDSFDDVVQAAKELAYNQSDGLTPVWLFCTNRTKEELKAK